MQACRRLAFLRRDHIRFHRPWLLAAALALALPGCGKDYMAAGQDSMQKGDDAAALIEYKNAVQNQPNSVAARLALADAFERNFDLASAEQHLRKALELGADKDVIVPRVASLMLDRGMPDALAREYKDQHLQNPEAESNLRALVAIAYVNQKRMALAQEQLREAVIKTPAIHVAMAQQLLASGQVAQALAELASMPTDAAAPWWTLRALGRVYGALNQPEQAMAAIEQAHAAAPWHRGLVGEYGEALFNANQIDKARALRDQLQRQAPNYFWTNYLNAVILAKEGHSDASHAAALKVLAVSPEHLPAILLASAAELQRGDVLMAESRLKKIARNHPDSVALLQMLATTQLRLGQAQAAQDSIRRGLAVAQDNEYLLSLQSDAQLQRGDSKAAAAALERILARNPGHAASLLRLSEIRLREGQRASANALLDRATAAGQDQPEIRDQIISIAMRSADVQRVRKLADHALQSSPQDPQSHLVQGVALGYQKDLPGARRAMLAALDLKPGFDAALAALAGLSSGPAQHAELLARYDKAVADPSSTARTFQAYAELLRQDAARQKDVLALLERGVAAHPGAAGLREALVQQHLRTGNTQQALSVAQSGASAPGASAAAQALLAQTYERVGKPELAMASYRKLVTNYPQRADWRLQLARLEAAAQQQAQAINLLRALMAERPFDSAAYIELARLMAPTHLNEAQAIARQLAEQGAAQRPAALLLQGEVLALAGKQEEALQQYRAAATAGADPVASLRLVSLLDSLGRSAQADTEMAALAQRFATSVPVVTQRAQRHLARGQADKAVQLLAQLDGVHPRHPVVLNELAWAQVQARQPKALETAQRAATLLPDDPRVLDTLGMAQALAGQRSEAIATLRTATHLAPLAASPRLHLAEQLLAAGERSAAAQALAGVDAGPLGKVDLAHLAQLKEAAGH